MLIVIRVDASTQIGTGHVMRCLTLADALSSQGAEVRFICRELPGNMIDPIRQRGFRVETLTAVAQDQDTQSDLEHGHWLTVSQQADAEQCADLLAQARPDWLVVDHYALDQAWQKMLQPFYNKLLVIDDLADRDHLADILVDQTFGRQQAEYRDRVPESAQLLTGAQFALLRKEFDTWRRRSLAERFSREPTRILLSMGGIDADNRSGYILEQLSHCQLPDNALITVVMGANAPHIDAVRSLATQLPFAVDVRVNVSNMAELMTSSDIAIGAAGSSTWERCCLGLPTLQVVIADNQKTIARKLSAAGAVIALQSNNLQDELQALFRNRHKLALISSAIVCRSGVAQVVEQMTGVADTDGSRQLMASTAEHCEFIYSLQTPEARRYSRTPEVPAFVDHQRWYQNFLARRDAVLFIVMKQGQPAGFLRLDGIDGESPEISIVTAPAFQGQGIASFAIRQGIAMLPGRELIGAVHRDNLASKTLFERLGFQLTSHDGDFLEYRYLSA